MKTNSRRGAPGGLLARVLPEFVTRLMGQEVSASLVNRGVLVVRPREPFIQWVAGLEGWTLEEARRSAAQELSAYLLPPSGWLEPDSGAMRAVYRYIWERELADWCTEPARWPQPRPRAQFREWFELIWCDGVLDLCEAPLEREAWEEEA